MKTGNEITKNINLMLKTLDNYPFQNIERGTSNDSEQIQLPVADGNRYSCHTETRTAAGNQVPVITSKVRHIGR